MQEHEIQDVTLHEPKLGRIHKTIVKKVKSKITIGITQEKSSYGESFYLITRIFPTRR